MSTYQRKIQTKPAKVTPLLVEIADLTQWLEEQAREHGLMYLLAHADDGVIWGRVTGGVLVTSDMALAKAHAREKWDGPRIADAKKTLPPLRLETLQQARLFCETGELLIWKDGDDNWQGRVIQDVKNGETADWKEAFDEPQLLWGTHGTALADEFTLLEDGAQGLRHAVPFALELENKKYGELKTKPKLWVRHYLAYDDQGQAYIALSRLVKLEKVA